MMERATDTRKRMLEVALILVVLLNPNSTTSNISECIRKPLGVWKSVENKHWPNEFEIRTKGESVAINL